MFVIFKHSEWRYLQQICSRNNFYDCQNFSDMSANCPDWCTMICFLFACPVRQLLRQHVGAPAESCKQTLLWCQLSDAVRCCQWCQVCDITYHLVGHNVKCLMPVASDAKCLTLVVWLKHWMRLGAMSAGAASCQWCQMFDESWFPVMASQCNNASPLFWPQSLSLFFAGKKSVIDSTFTS